MAERHSNIDPEGNSVAVRFAVKNASGETCAEAKYAARIGAYSEQAVSASMLHYGRARVFVRAKDPTACRLPAHIKK